MMNQLEYLMQLLIIDHFIWKRIYLADKIANLALIKGADSQQIQHGNGIHGIDHIDLLTLNSLINIK